MPKGTQENTTTEKCTGGRSLNRKPGEHKQGKKIYCYRCNVYQGCSNCCEILSEIICLKCHNWASRAGVARHGNVVPKDQTEISAALMREYEEIAATGKSKAR